MMIQMSQWDRKRQRTIFTINYLRPINEKQIESPPAVVDSTDARLRALVSLSCSRVADQISTSRGHALGIGQRTGGVGIGWGWHQAIVGPRKTLSSPLRCWMRRPMKQYDGRRRKVIGGTCPSPRLLVCTRLSVSCLRPSVCLYVDQSLRPSVCLDLYVCMRPYVCLSVFAYVAQINIICIIS